MIYVGLEISVHENKVALSLISIFHIMMSLVVFKFGYEVTKSDAGHVSKED